jgi:CHAT domain-containing protein
MQQHLTDDTTAAIYWHLSPAALTTFILKPHADPIPLTANLPPHHTEELPESLQRLIQFENWATHWQTDYQDYRSDKSKSRSQHPWRTQMPSRLDALRRILNVDGILAHLQDRPIRNLILLPHRDLHLFPLEALFPPQYNLVRLPSAQTGINLASQPVPPVNADSPLLSIEYPNSDQLLPLEFAQFEAETIARPFHRVRHLPENQATQARVKSELCGDYRILHFTGHATYHLQTPTRSFLALARRDTLTLEDLLQLPLSSYRLVSLAACETAIAGDQSITAEYVGLTSGFLTRGVSLVLSTLWTVGSTASALLAIEFYRQLLAGQPEPIALGSAKTWLRQCSARQLQQFYAAELQHYPEDEDELRPFLHDQIDELDTMEPNARPYAHPYYWASFTLTGFSSKS